MKTSYYRTPDTTPGAICISRSAPRYSRYRHYRPLKPGPWFRSVSELEYRRLYAEILGQLDPQQVWNELHELAGSAEPILLCYEKPGDFCHRRLVADWLETTLGVEVPEASGGPVQLLLGS